VSSDNKKTAQKVASRPLLNQESRDFWTRQKNNFWAGQWKELDNDIARPGGSHMESDVERSKNYKP